MKQSFILTLSNSENSRHPPIALARYRMLLMFFTSVLMPSGSPGLWTDTFASTLNCPSEGETEISMGMKCGSSVPECVGQTGRKKERKKMASLPDMLPWQVPRACRMSWSSLTAAAASSPQLMSGSITNSIRPTPDGREDSCSSRQFLLWFKQQSWMWKIITQQM